MEKDLTHLLIYLKGERFIQILEDHSFDASNLKYLTKTCLDEIIPKNLYGHRLEFEYHLAKWQKEQGVSIGHYNIFESQVRPSQETCSTNFLQLGFDEISVETILTSSLSGKQILLFYDKNHHLNSTHRKLLSNCVVEYLIGNKFTSTPKVFEKIATKIQDLFPTEDKEIYYMPIKGRKPAGYLYSKYHNSISKLRKDGVYETNFVMQEIEENDITPESLKDDAEYELQISSKKWLKYNVEPLNEVLQKWEETFILRRSYINEQHNLLEIMEEWPLLKQTYGYKLITSDFSLLFPDKINLLFEKWEGFCKPILELIKKQVKSSESVELLQELKASQSNYELRNIIIIHLLHALLKPSTRKCIISENNRKRKFAKTSIEDSRSAFLLWAPTIMELNTKIKLIIDDLYIQHQTLKPIICGIGNSLLHLDNFYVFYCNVFYKLSNLITCVDVAFKIFYVLNIKYPEDCKNVWLFFQQYFFDIDVKSPEKSTILVSVLNDIKTIK